MKNALLKTLSVSLLCCAGFTLAHADDISKAENQAQVRACAKKQQGDWVTYSYKGVTFNGTCQPNADGKLQFKSPAP